MESSTRDDRLAWLLTVARRSRSQWVHCDSTQKETNKCEPEDLSNYPAATTIQRSFDYLSSLVGDGYNINIGAMLRSLEDSDATDFSLAQSIKQGTYEEFLDGILRLESFEVLRSIQQYVSKADGEVRKSHQQRLKKGAGDSVPQSVASASVWTFIDRIADQIRRLPPWSNTQSSEDQWLTTKFFIEKFVFTKLYPSTFAIDLDDWIQNERLRERLQSLSFLGPQHLDIKYFTTNHHRHHGTAIQSTSTSTSAGVVTVTFEDVIAEPVRTLKQLQHWKSPTEKMACLKDCAHAIINSIKMYQQQQQQQREQIALTSASSANSGGATASMSTAVRGESGSSSGTMAYFGVGTTAVNNATASVVTNNGAIGIVNIPNASHTNTATIGAAAGSQNPSRGAAPAVGGQATTTNVMQSSSLSSPTPWSPSSPSSPSSASLLSLGADEFLPVMILVVKTCSPNNLHSELRYLERYTPSDRMEGECGYLLTQLASAVRFLETLDASSVSMSPVDFQRELQRCRVAAVRDSLHGCDVIDSGCVAKVSPFFHKSGGDYSNATGINDKDLRLGDKIDLTVISSYFKKEESETVRSALGLSLIPTSSSSNSDRSSLLSQYGHTSISTSSGSSTSDSSRVASSSYSPISIRDVHRLRCLR